MSIAVNLNHDWNQYSTVCDCRNQYAECQSRGTYAAVHRRRRRTALLDLGALDMHEKFVARVVIVAEIAQHGAGGHVGVMFHHASDH